jgi:drug/metabolite transporter (DMT)-like permease
LTVLAFIGCALIWSTTWFAIRVCIGPGGYPPYAGAAIRFLMASALLGLLTALGLAGRPLRGWRPRAWVGLAGLLCGIGYGLVYAGETRISGGLAAVIFGTLPLVLALVTSLLGTERTSLGSLLGFLVALGGIAVIYRDRMSSGSGQAAGVALIFASVCVTAAYNPILKRHTEGSDPLAASTIFLGTAGVVLALFAVAHERSLPPWPPPLRPTLALVYLAVMGSVVAFALFFHLIRHMSLGAVSTLVFIEPIVAMLIDAVWERQVRLGVQAYAGAALTLLGVGASVLARRSAGRSLAPS